MGTRSFGIRAVVVAVSLAASTVFVGTQPAAAADGLNAAITFQEIVAVGTTGNGHIGIKNLGTTDLTIATDPGIGGGVIYFTPSCGAISQPCALPETAITLNSPATVSNPLNCTAQSFEILGPDASGRYTFVPNTTITLAPNAECNFGFTFNAVSMPTNDSNPNLFRVQTVQILEVTAKSPTGIVGTVPPLRTNQITIAEASMTLEKTASTPGGVFPLDVTYTYLVKNTGTSFLEFVGVTDDRCAPVTYVSGDTNGQGFLDLTEVFTFTCSTTLNQPGPITNTATASGTAVESGITPVVATATDTALVNVTCAPGHTISGPTGTRNLSGGSWCIQNAQVSGSININPGTAVFISDSSVTGNIVSTGATAFTLCKSTVGGQVTVRNSTGDVVVGDPTIACAGNSMVGGLTLSNNQSGVTASKNSKIGGSLILSTNVGGPHRIEANKVFGSLGCSGNNLPPTNSGQPNIVTGSRSGQCAGF